MRPILKHGSVAAACPDCEGSITSFEFRSSSAEYGHIERPLHHWYQSELYTAITYQLLRCASCGRGGLAEIHLRGGGRPGVLGEFFPFSVERAQLPNGVPSGVLSEIREAETCAGMGTNRAALAMLRSALEKTLKSNGYTDEDKKLRNLQAKIDQACADGIIPASMQRRVQEEIRGVANFVLHDDWDEVEPQTVADAHRYVQRVVEHFYDDRTAVLNILNEKGRKPMDVSAREDSGAPDAAAAD